MGKFSLANLQKEQKAIRKKLASKSAKKEKSAAGLKSKSVEKKGEKQNKENVMVTQTLKESAFEKKNLIDTKKNGKIGLVETVNLAASEKKSKFYEEKPKNQMKLSKKEREKVKEEELLMEKEDKVYPEHEEKINKKFIKSLKDKKAFANRISPKVTEVYPIVESKEKPAKIKDREGPIKEVDIDEM